MLCGSGVCALHDLELRLAVHMQAVPLPPINTHVSRLGLGWALGAAGLGLKKSSSCRQRAGGQGRGLAWPSGFLFCALQLLGSYFLFQCLLTALVRIALLRPRVGRAVGQGRLRPTPRTQLTARELIRAAILIAVCTCKQRASTPGSLPK